MTITPTTTMLPKQPVRLNKKLPFFEQGYLTAIPVVRSQQIVAFDGEPGTGKTTCARYIAQHCGLPAAVVTLPHRPAPLDLLRHMHREIVGTPGVGTRFDMQGHLLEVFNTWHGVVVVDEMQNTQANAMQELVWLYEESGHAFSLVVVGTGVLQALQRHPQLLSRTMGQVLFQPLRGKVLLNALHAMDPRLAAASTADLQTHDSTLCHGLLRPWVQTVRWLNMFDVDGVATADHLADVRAAMPDPLADLAVSSSPKSRRRGS